MGHMGHGHELNGSHGSWVTEVDPFAALETILANLPTTSALHQILSTANYLPLQNPKQTLNILETLALSNSIDTLTSSVPYSLRSFYVKLLTAATYEKYKLDIPYDCEYVASANPHSQNPYQTQLRAYGLECLLTASNQLTPQTLPLVNVPEFKTATYYGIQKILEISNEQMATSFLTTLLHTQIRNSDHLSTANKKSATKTQTYAAVTADRLPIKHKPKSIRPSQPMNATKYPCAKCILSATLLTTTEKKYAEKLQLQPRFKSIEEYTNDLPKPSAPASHQFSMNLPTASQTTKSLGAARSQQTRKNG